MVDEVCSLMEGVVIQAYMVKIEREFTIYNYIYSKDRARELGVYIGIWNW